MTLKEAQNIMGLRDEELIVDGCKVTTEYDEVYFKCKAEKLESYVGGCYSDEDALDEMADNEEWYSHSYRQNGNEVEEI